MNKQLYALALLAFCISSTSDSHAQGFTQPLNVMDTLVGPNYNLTYQTGTWQFNIGQNTGTRAYNGDVLGPTLIMNAGDSVHISFTNTTNDTTSTHWHGLHVPANVDGTHYNMILPGETWTPSFKVMNKAATYWYHPHLFGSTNFQVSKGASGMIIVRDAEEAALALPRTYGVDDFPIIVQSKIINPINGQIVLAGPFDTTMVVNGVQEPVLEVPAQPVRFRLLNAASRRYFKLGLSDDRAFNQIATDGGLTPEPLELNRILLGNGERYEIVVDFTGLEDSTYYLMNYGTELGAFIPGGALGGGGMGSNPYDSADFALMRIDVVAPTSDPAAFDPDQAQTTIDVWDEADADTTREILFSGGLGTPFIFGDTIFQHNIINQVIPLGNIEVWDLVNTTFLTHPFHVHDVQFNILEMDELPTPIEYQGLKDVVNVPAFSSARIIMRFEDFADEDHAYMYHCHNLAHEDEGMMGQFIVVDTVSIATTIADMDAPYGLFVHPNPTNDGRIRLHSEVMIDNAALTVYNSLGSLVSVTQLLGVQTAYVELPEPTGMYFIHLLSSDGQKSMLKVIKE